ncbi:hypothetical protein HDG35_007509 [Paraburkholderia sp. JPY681]|uniref:Uncharacterized protein n=1 Tax=Paraburkholderia atlantica TaxID=2654982 RepID=D5WP46_PARAM|nr:hypothetical protein BC1002_6860 [Paraburkholderia atlantica]MBB5511212.1 hypothetical protein [Paraburkholderia atlantica]
MRRNPLKFQQSLIFLEQLITGALMRRIFFGCPFVIWAEHARTHSWTGGDSPFFLM